MSKYPMPRHRSELDQRRTDHIRLNRHGRFRGYLTETTGLTLISTGTLVDDHAR